MVTRLAAVRQTIRDSRPNADIFAPELPYYKHWLCCQKAEDIVAMLVGQIDALVRARAEAGGRYSRISLVGHSIGAVLARKIAIVAFGEQTDTRGYRPAPFEPEFRNFRLGLPWAALIQRIVLLAGVNRGWSVSSAVDWITSVCQRRSKNASAGRSKNTSTMLASRAPNWGPSSDIRLGRDYPPVCPSWHGVSGSCSD